MSALLTVFCLWLAVGLVVSVRSSMRSAQDSGIPRGLGAVWGTLRVLLALIV